MGRRALFWYSTVEVSERKGFREERRGKSFLGERDAECVVQKPGQREICEREAKVII